MASADSTSATILEIVLSALLSPKLTSDAFVQHNLYNSAYCAFMPYYMCFVSV